MTISERDIQKSIMDYLDWQKDIYYIRNNSFAGKIFRSNGSTGWIRNNKPGAPDIVMCVRGRWIGVEVKVPNGRQSDLQKDAEVKIRNAGGMYWIVRSIDEFRENLTIV